MKEDLEKVLMKLKEEKIFLEEGHVKAKSVYNAKMHMVNIS